MNKLIELGIKLSGAGWVWGKVDGLKTKLSAIGFMLTGAAAMLTGSAKIINALVACKDLACGIGLARGIADNPHAMTVVGGFLAFQTGLGILGIGHKLEKANVPPQTPPETKP